MKYSSLILATIALSSHWLLAAAQEDVIYLSPFQVEGEVAKTKGFGLEDGSQTTSLSPSSASQRQLDDLSKAIPEFHNASAGAGSFGNVYSLRGSANTPFFGTASMSIYIDGIPSLSPYAFPSELGSFVQATVSKGAQSSRVGQNSPAGHISINTPAPSSKPLRFISVEAGSDSLAKGSILVQGQIENSNFGYSLFGYGHQMDGVIDNLADSSSEIGDINHHGTRAKLHWKNDNGFKAKLLFAWDRIKDGEQPFTHLDFDDPFTISKTFDGETNQLSRVHALTLEQDFGDTELVWTSSHSSWELGPYLTQLNLPPSLDSNLKQDITQRTHELVFRATEKSDSVIDWETGLYWEDKETTGDIFRELTGLFPIEGSSFQLESDNIAIRANGSARLTEAFVFGAGVRVDQNKQDFVRNEFIPSISQVPLSSDETSLQGDAFLTYSTNDNSSISLRWHASEKPGGFSAYTADPNLMQFGRERSTGIELNGNWEAENNRYGLSASIYRNDVADYHIERSFTQSDYYVINAEQVDITGGEFSIWANPSEQVTMSLSHSITEATIEAYFNPAYIGNMVPYIPENSTYASIAWQAHENWLFRTNWNHQSDIYFDEINNLKFNADSYLTGDIWARYSTEQFAIEFGIRNLTDETYDTFINAGINHRVNGLPRQYILRLEKAF